MHIQIFDFAQQNGYVYGTFLCNSMSLAHLSSRDMSSDLKAEIINRRQLAQTNTHTSAHGRVSTVRCAARSEPGEGQGDKMELNGNEQRKEGNMMRMREKLKTDIKEGSFPCLMLIKGGVLFYSLPDRQATLAVC